MRQTHNLYQPLYNNKILAVQMARLNKTPEQAAKDSGLSISSVNAGLAGNLGTLRKLRQLCDALNVNWEFITRIDLPESQYRRAVVEAGR